MNLLGPYLGISGRGAQSQLDLYFAKLAEVGTAPDAAWQSQVTDLIGDLVAADFLNRFDRLWLRSPSSPAGALICFVSLTSQTDVGSPIFDVAGPVGFNGSSSYCNTNYIPNTHHNKFSSTGRTLGVYVKAYSLTGATNTLMGGNQAVNGRPTKLYKDAAGLMHYIPGAPAYQSDGDSIPLADDGLYVGTASSSLSTSNVYYEGAIMNSLSPLVSEQPNFLTQPLFVGANNNNGTPNNFANFFDCTSFVAGQFTTAEHATLRSIFHDFMVARGLF